MIALEPVLGEPARIPQLRVDSLRSIEEGGYAKIDVRASLSWPDIERLPLVADMGIESLATPLVKKALSRALEIENEQVTLLKRIDRNITLMLGAAYEDGREHLEIAMRPGTETGASREEAIKARDSFIEAYNRLVGDPYKQSLAAVQLVATSLVLGEGPRELQKWALRAHEEAVAATQLRCKEINENVGKKTFTGQDRISIATQSVLFGAGIAIAVFVAFAVVFPFGLSVLGVVFVMVAILVLVGGGMESLVDLVKAEIAAPLRRKAVSQVQGMHEYVSEVAALCRGVGTPSSSIPAYEIVDSSGTRPVAYRAVAG